MCLCNIHSNTVNHLYNHVKMINTVQVIHYYIQIYMSMRGLSLFILKTVDLED